MTDRSEAVAALVSALREHAVYSLDNANLDLALDAEATADAIVAGALFPAMLAERQIERIKDILRGSAGDNLGTLVEIERTVYPNSPEVRAALAAPVAGLDVERLAEALDVGEWPPSEYPAGYRDPRWIAELARRVAAEYARLTANRTPETP